MDAETVHVIPSSPSGNGEIKESSPSKTNASAGSTSKPKTKVSRRPCNLPLETVEYLKAWMMSPEHIAHPYPTEKEKQEIMADTGIELKQLTNWFVNNRKRYWKPLVEAKLQKQQQHKKTVSEVKAVNNADLFCPSLISYPTSAKATISVVPKIPVNDFTVSNIQFNRTVSTENIPQLANDSTEEEIPPEKADLVKFKLALNYHPHSFTSLVSDNSSLPDSDEDNASTGASVSSESPVMMEDTCPEIEDYSSNDQSISGVVEYPSDEPLPTKKRSIDDIDSISQNQPKKPSTWREVCANANNANDSSLPSLDEAAKLFGFTK